METPGTNTQAPPGGEDRDRVFRFVLRLTGDGHRAEDIAQETMMRVLRAGVAPSPAYLFKVARNLLRDEARMAAVRRRGPVDPGSLADPRASEPLPAMVREEQRDLVWNALGTLPEKERTALVLRFGEGASCSAIGDVLDLTPNAVSCLLHRAKEHLRAAVPPGRRP